MTIKEITTKKHDTTVKFKGWVTANRGNSKIRFININDGSTFEGLQVIFKTIDITLLDNVKLGAAMAITGTLKITPDRKQALEVVASSYDILQSGSSDYPLQKKEMSREFLREIPHLRHRTNLFRAVMRIRSTLFQQLHHFFASKNFLALSSPIITSNDGEGAGETFIVNASKKAFFGQQANLAVTGQLHGEAFATGFGNVYTFGPTFRAENSHTQRHVAEFWMLEPEMAFYDKDQTIDLADAMLKSTIAQTIKLCPEEFAFLNEHVDQTLLKRLQDFLSTKITKISYQEAIDKLVENKNIFDEKNIVFGMDLGTEHEKYLAEKIIGGPVAIYDFPKAIKAFYMKENADQKTVAAFDILAPGIGEIIGGSERECDIDKLIKRIKELKIDVNDLQWYLDLRKYGQVQSSGFGLGFGRLVMYVTGIENIRDSIPFPRTPNNLKM